MRRQRDPGNESDLGAGPLPVLIARRCVHALIEVASCRACADACPLNAWEIDDEQLGIDTDRCDGCNLCAAVCPEGAIQADIVPALKNDNRKTAAMLACEAADIPPGPGVVPCLHAFGLNAVMTLYRKGIESLVCSSGDCDNCHRGAAPRLSGRLTAFNRLLRERGLPAMRHRDVSADEWLDMVEQSPAQTVGPPMSRRQFFRRATQTAISEHQRLQSSGDPAADVFEPAGSIIPSQSTAQIVPFLPQIEPTRCNACDACSRLCPHGAITIETEGPSAARAYRIAPELCSGCSICEDVCDRQAVSVSTWSIPGRLRVPLDTDRCRSCGATYYTPVGGLPGDGQCRICGLTQSHRLLFQVFD